VTKPELPALRAQLLAELTRLADVLTQVRALALDLQGREPTRVELMAAGGFLQNLYNGFENCMTRVAHGVDESVPTGSDWHRLLLDQMSEPIPGLRPASLGGSAP
jgi:hypothetical protein